MECTASRSWRRGARKCLQEVTGEQGGVHRARAGERDKDVFTSTTKEQGGVHRARAGGERRGNAHKKIILILRIESRSLILWAKI